MDAAAILTECEEANRKLARRIAREWKETTGVDPEDLEGAGIAAILENAPSFDPGLGNRPWTFLKHHARGAMMKFVRKEHKESHDRYEESDSPRFEDYMRQGHDDDFARKNNRGALAHPSSQRIADLVEGANLTAEDARIVARLASGELQTEIAADLGVSSPTMSRRVEGIYDRIRKSLAA